jgi:hypothetical protein
VALPDSAFVQRLAECKLVRPCITGMKQMWPWQSLTLSSGLHVIFAFDYDSLLVDGSLPDSNLGLLNHTLANIAPPTTQSRPQQGHEAQELFSDPIETCENATDTRQKWSKIQKEEIHRRKDLQQQFKQKGRRNSANLCKLCLQHNKRKPKKSSMAVVPPIKSQL